MGRSHASDVRNSSARKGGGVDRIHLIELIEAQTARLSDEGRGLWEELEFLRESIPDAEEPSRMAREYDIMERIFELPVHQQFITSRLASWLAVFVQQRRRNTEGSPGTATGLVA